MKVESKYNIGDVLLNIRSISERVIRDCEVCFGSGRIQYGDKKYTCPECNGEEEKTIYLPEKWKLDRTLTIGRILFDCDDTKVIVKYMAHETGCPSGMIFYEDELFESEVDALSECERRNNKGLE